MAVRGKAPEVTGNPTGRELLANGLPTLIIELIWTKLGYC